MSVEVAAPSVRVVGNELVNGAGQPMRLLGVDRSGTEYACVQGWGIFDGPSDATSIAAMASWDVDAVRVPLNEDCWLGINGVDPAYSGVNYQEAIEGYIQELNAAGLVAILDLHWNAPGTELATGQQEMADADHSITFWSSVAEVFREVPGVIFDLYNEPNGISWSCWLNGCTTASGWQTAGMQQMLDAVRAAGATQPVMVAGLNWAGDLSQWLAYEPVDPLHQLVASVHIYDFSECNTESCWNETIAPVAAQVPVVTGELGEKDCGSSFIDSYMNWADSVGVSYLGWTWDTWNCSGGPALISSYEGTPTAFGAGLKQHLAELADASQGTGAQGTGNQGAGSQGTDTGGQGAGSQETGTGGQGAGSQETGTGGQATGGQGTGQATEGQGAGDQGPQSPAGSRRHHAGQAGRVHDSGAGHRRLPVGRPRRRHPRRQRLRLLRLHGRPPPQRAHRGHGRHAGRWRLVAGGLRRRAVRLR